MENQMNLFSGLYGTENRKTEHEVFCQQAICREWNSMKEVLQLSTEENDILKSTLQYLTIDEILLIGSYLCGEIPTHVTRKSQKPSRLIKEIDLYVQEIERDNEEEEELNKKLSLLSGSPMDDDDDDDESNYKTTYVDDEEGNLEGISLVPKRIFPSLVKVKANASILGPCCRFSITQTYFNDTRKKIESVFVYPKTVVDRYGVKNHINVCSFQASVGGRSISGKICEKDEAQSIFKERKDGQGCYIFESEKNSYLFLIGSILPEEKVEISLEFLMECTFLQNGNVAELHIPLRLMVPMASEDENEDDNNNFITQNVKFEYIPLSVDALMPCDVTSCSEVANIDGNHVKIETVIYDWREGDDYVISFALNGELNGKAIMYAQQDRNNTLKTAYLIQYFLDNGLESRTAKETPLKYKVYRKLHSYETLSYEGKLYPGKGLVAGYIGKNSQKPYASIQIPSISKNVPISSIFKVNGKQIISTFIASQFVRENEKIASEQQKTMKVAKSYNIVSDYTSFISVKKGSTGSGFSLKEIETKSGNVRKKETVYVPVYNGGSGWGEFVRTGSLVLDTISSGIERLGTKIQESLFPKRSPVHSKEGKELKNREVPTPFGFSAVLYRVGEVNPPCETEITHVIKGPVADIEGHNCWLNALLSFLIGSDTIRHYLLTMPMVVDHVNFNMIDDLALLFKIWVLQNDYTDETMFRNDFDFVYNRLWIHFQQNGFIYGEDYSVVQAYHFVLSNLVLNGMDVSTITFVSKSQLEQMNKWNHSEIIVCDDNHRSILDLQEYGHEKDFYISSFISFQTLAKTQQGRDINHFCSIHSLQTGGHIVYDDILKFDHQIDYQGGFVPKASEDQIKTFTNHVPLVIIKKKKKKNMCLEQRKTYTSLEQVTKSMNAIRHHITLITYTPHDKKAIKFEKGVLTLAEALHVLRYVRFGCHFNLPALREQNILNFLMLISKSDYPICSSYTKDKTMLSIQKELKLIISQKNACLGFEILCRYDVFNSIFEIPSRKLEMVLYGSEILQKAIDSMIQEKNKNHEQFDSRKLFQAFLSPFNCFQHEIKKNRKRKATPLGHIFLKNLLFSNKEIDELMCKKM